MTTVVWDAYDVIDMDFFEPGTTINSERYTEMLVTLKRLLRRIRKHKKNILLQNDNARSHISRAIMEAIENLDLTILPHSTYSPDLATYDFNLSPKMMEDLHGHLCGSNDVVKRTVRKLMKKLSVNFFHDGFDKLVHCWCNCVENCGEYMEK
jgi:hypothetical protein